MLQKPNTRANILRAKRAEYEFNQEYIANELETSTITYSRKERGEAEFTQSEIFTLMKKLSLSNDEVIDIFFSNMVTDVLK